jgi:hypothetical protein
MVQLTFWASLMPEVPTLDGAAPRFSSYTSIVYFVLLWASMLAGIALGKVAANSKPGVKITLKNDDDAIKSPSPKWIRTLFSLSSIALAISLLGEFVYIREIIANPSIVKDAFDAGNMANVGLGVMDARVIGVSSLNNLFVVPTAIYAMIMFNPNMGRLATRRAKKWLFTIGCASITHAILFSARMFVVYYVAIIVAAYILNKPVSYRIRLRTVFKTTGFLAAIIWIGELLRGGLWYSTNNNIGLFTVQTQQYIIDRLVQGYFAADFNNAMVLLDYPPTYQFFSTTPFSHLISNVFDYSSIPNWTSAFGTVNILGLLWFDSGVFTFAICLLGGAMLGVAYKVAMRSASNISFTSLIFIIAYPGIWSMIRINYFAGTIFIIPLVFLMLAGMVVDIWYRQQNSPKRNNDFMARYNIEQCHNLVYLRKVND